MIEPRSILLVEDEAPKRDQIAAFLAKLCPNADVQSAKSVRAAIAAMKREAPSLLILDMSLPTFDVGPYEAGGRPQGFGGVEVVRYLKLLNLEVPVIVVTAYEAFVRRGGDVDLKGLSEQLRKEYGPRFHGLVYYNSLYGSWRDELKTLLASLRDKNENIAG